MEFLFLIFIYPLQAIMKSVLDFTYIVTNNYVVSIGILSIVVNILLLPLYHFAEKLQNKERLVQRKLRPKLKEIKSNFQGAERFMMIHTLYRQVKYHPVYAIRTSLGFLIQVPFFLAAYLLLLHFEAFNGVSELWFSDLSRPDKLLYGINLMPILMTAINLASAFVYCQNLTDAEKRQIWIIAILFLILLYHSPVALVLYWTLNNVFSLLKNIGYHIYERKESTPEEGIRNLKSLIHSKFTRLLSYCRCDLPDHFRNTFTSTASKLLLLLLALDQFIFYLPVSTSLTLFRTGTCLSLFGLSTIFSKSPGDFFRQVLAPVKTVQSIFKKHSPTTLFRIGCWWGLLILALYKARVYRSLRLHLDKSDPATSLALSLSISALAILSVTGLYAYITSRLKHSLPKNGLVSLLVVSAFGILSLFSCLLWVTDSYLIQNPAYMKEILAGALFGLLISVHFYQIRRFFRYLADIRGRFVKAVFQTSYGFKGILIFLTMTTVYSFLSTDNPFHRQFHFVELIGISGVIFMVILEKIRSYQLDVGIGLFLSLSSLLYFMLVVAGPFMIYASSLESINSSKMQLIIPHLRIFFQLLSGSTLIYLFASENIKKLMVYLTAFAVVSGYLYTFVIIGNFGHLDAFKFENPALLDIITGQMVIEIFALTVLATVVWKFLPGLQKVLMPLSVLVLLTMAGYTSFQLASNDAIKAVTHTGTPEALQQVHTYSADQNVVILMLDGFAGVEAARIIQSHPDFLDQFTGFTWYPNTLSVSTKTWSSIATMSAGPTYTPEAVNRKKNVSFREEITKAYNTLSRGFQTNGYNVSYINPQYGDCQKLNGVNCFKSFKPLVPVVTHPISAETISVISIFKAAPFFLKKWIYQKGEWHTKTQTNIRRSTDKIRHLEFLKWMGKNLTVSKDEKKTFKFYQFSVPHTPAILNKNCEYTSYGKYEAEAACAMLYISNFIKSLKAAGIYDQTKIILVSDHGQPGIKETGLFENDMQNYLRQVASESKENRLAMQVVQPLLMVKDFNTRHHSIKRNNTFMSNGDMASIACSAVGGCPDIPPDPTQYPILNRKLKIFNAYVNKGRGQSPVYQITDQYEVVNSIFERKNWKKIK